MGRRLSLSLPLLAACTVHPPRAPLVIDGHLDERAWRTPLRSGPFLDAAGAEAVPWSDARFLVDDRFLYVALYASDEDVRPSDAFTLQVGETTYTLTAGGDLSPRPPGALIAADADGTLDVPGDSDEEWVVEARLPAPRGRVPIVAGRCDAGRCGAIRLTFDLR